MAQPKPLNIHQQELVGIVRAAHQTLAIARRVRTAELARRMAEERIRAERDFEEAEIRIKDQLAAEIVAHEANLDEALIFAYNEGVPIRRIALDGFGNRYDGGVSQLVMKLRADGRLGHREGWQVNTGVSKPKTAFPQAVDLQKIIHDSNTLDEPTFTVNPERLVLVPADENGEDGVSVVAVTMTMDARDPWFAQIEKNARPGTPFRGAIEVTLYEHPATGELISYESRETGELLWDHPVARWVKHYPESALAGFRSATLADFLADEDSDEQIATLGDKLDIRTAPESSE